MKTLRTPDDRFAGLPGYDFAPHYAEVADGEGGTLRVHYLREGDPSAPVVLLHARRALLVLPLPQDDPRPDRGRAADRGARPGRLRALGQAGRARRLHVRPPRRVDARAALRPARPARRHAGLPGLGRAHRPAAGGRAPGPLRPGRGGQHLPADRATPTRARPSSPGSASPRRSTCSRPASSSTAAASSRMPPEVQAAYDAPFPDESYKAGARQFPMLVPVAARRPGPRRQRGRLGGPGRLRPALPVRLQRQRPHHPGSRPHPEGADRRRPGPAPHDDRRRRALPPGGLRGGAGRGRRRPSSPPTS